MKLLKRVARRFLPHVHTTPPAPVDARHSFHSMIFSADDDMPPSSRLISISLESVQALREQVRLGDIASQRNVPAYFNVWPGEHYRLLGAIMLMLRPRLVVEIGTFTGLSALAMKKYLPPAGRIVTFDIQPWQQIPDTVLTEEDFADGRLMQIVGDLGDADTFARHRDLLAQADFMFIDGPKDGKMEYRLIEQMEAVRFAGEPILMFDDTKLWSMLRFWRLLKRPKLDLTSFGSWSGTGLVDWCGQPAESAEPEPQPQLAAAG